MADRPPHAIAGWRQRRTGVPRGDSSPPERVHLAEPGEDRLEPASAWTREFIPPPYAFSAVDALLTNFHLPRTTLLLLVAAPMGEDLVRRAYAHAVVERYHFFSYGVATLIA